MPRPHFPSHGGANSHAYSHRKPAPPKKGSASSSAPSPNTASPNQRALEEEVQRLRQELARVQSGGQMSPPPLESRFAITPSNMVWVALTLTGFALLFALIAILNHG